MNYQTDILNAIKTPTSFVDLNYKYVFVNRAYSNYYNCEPGDIVGKTVSAFLGKEHFLKKVKPCFDACLKGEQITCDSLADIEKNGGEHCLQMDYYPHYNEKNEFDGIIFTDRDKTSEYCINQNWQHAMNAVDDVVIVIDKEYNVIDINQYGLAFLKKQKHEVIGQKCYNFFHYLDMAESYCLLLENLKDEKTGYSEFYNELLGKHYSIKTTPIYNKNGGLSHFVAVMRDITLLKEKENKIKNTSEDYVLGKSQLNRLNISYDLLNKYSSDAIAMYDENMKPIYISPSTVNHSGYNPDEFDNMDVFDIVHPEDKVKLLAEIEHYREENITNYTTTYRIKHKKGYYFWNESVTQVIKDISSHGNIIIVNNRNIDARRNAEEALTKSKHNYRLLVENMNDLVCEIDEEGRFTYLNKQYEHILGYKAEELIGQKAIDLIHPDDLHESLKKYETLKNKEKQRIDIWRFRHKNGSYRIIESKGAVYEVTKKQKRTVVISRDITDNKKAEHALKESETRYKKAEQIAHLGSWEMDIKTAKAIWSDEFFRICGFEPQSFAPTAEKGFNSIHPKDQERAAKAVEKAIASGNPYNIEKRIVRPSGEVRWVRSQGEIIYDNNKQPRTLVGSFLDITESKQAKQNAVQSEKRFRNMFEYHSAIMLLIEPKTGEIINANRSAIEFYGYDLPTLRSMYISDINQLNPNQIRKERIKASKMNSNYFVFPHKLSSGEVRTVEVHSTPIKQEGKQILFSIIHDITKRSKAEKELIKAKKLSEISELKYKTIFEGAPIGIFRSTLEGKFIEVNPKLANMLGYKTSQEVIENIYDISRQIYVKGSKRKSIVESTSKINIDKYDNVYKRKNGELFNANLYLRKVTDENGNEILEGIVEETTERKKYENKLKTALEKAEESSRLKSEFINNMSHEVRTPMNGIMGFAQMLKRPNMRPEKKEYYTRIIQQNSKQLLKIIDGILEISRLETSQVKVFPENFCLNLLLEHLYTTFKKQVQPEVTFTLVKSLSDGESTIISDKPKLIKILSNLIENAIKFTHAGFIEIGYQRKSDKLELYVKDTGIGVDPQNKDLIFERFSHENTAIANEKGGLGIGLFIAKENTILLGGEITLNSQKGQGSAFYVTLPYTRIEGIDKNDCSATVITPTNNNRGHYTILIAEDDKSNSIYLEALLEDEIRGNFEVIQVKNGQEAIDLCQKNKSIDLILMDLKMPGIDGIEATKKIKNFLPELPVIAQTASSSENDIEMAKNAGCDDFISKPILREDLSLLLRKFL